MEQSKTEGKPKQWNRGKQRKLEKAKSNQSLHYSYHLIQDVN